MFITLGHDFYVNILGWGPMEGIIVNQAKDLMDRVIMPVLRSRLILRDNLNKIVVLCSPHTI